MAGSPVASSVAASTQAPGRAWSGFVGRRDHAWSWWWEHRKPREVLVSVGSRSVDVNRSHRWVVAGLLAFVLAMPAGASGAAGPVERATAAVPTVSGDQAATRALLDAEYELLKATLARSRSTDAAVAHAAKVLGDECRGALRGVPDESVIEEEPPRSRPRFSAGVQGERARSEHEKSTIDLEIDKTIVAAGARVLHGSYDAYIAMADRLTWSDSTITALAHQAAMRRREGLRGPAGRRVSRNEGLGGERVPPAAARKQELGRSRGSSQQAGRAGQPRNAVGQIRELCRPGDRQAHYSAGGTPGRTRAR